MPRQVFKWLYLKIPHHSEKDLSKTSSLQKVIPPPKKINKLSQKRKIWKHEVKCVYNTSGPSGWHLSLVLVAWNTLEYFYIPLDGMLVNIIVGLPPAQPFIQLGGHRHCESHAVSCSGTQHNGTGGAVFLFLGLIFEECKASLVLTVQFEFHYFRIMKWIQVSPLR